MSNEARVLDSFGPNLVIETNGPVGVGGGFAYQLYSITKKGSTWQQALHESLSLIHISEPTRPY